MCPPDFSPFSYVLVQKRNMLRLTAKSTQFGRRTFTSWLIESAGTVPIKRKKDYPDGQVDNSNVMEKLIEVCFSSSDSFIFWTSEIYPQKGFRTWRRSLLVS